MSGLVSGHHPGWCGRVSPWPLFSNLLDDEAGTVRGRAGAGRGAGRRPGWFTDRDRLELGPTISIYLIAVAGSAGRYTSLETQYHSQQSPSIHHPVLVTWCQHSAKIFV